MRATLFLALSLNACLMGCAGYGSVAVDDGDKLSKIPDDRNLCVKLRSGDVLEIRDFETQPSVLTGVLERRGKPGSGTGICGKHGDIDWSDEQDGRGKPIEIPVKDVDTITYGGPSLGGALIAFVVIAGVAVLIASNKSGNLGDAFDP